MKLSWLFVAILLAGNAAGRPMRTALYDGPAEDLVERLKAGKIERLVVLKGVEFPVDTAKAIREAGIEILQTEPVSLKALPSGPVAIQTGKWPGLRAAVLFEKDRDIGFAGATPEPWVEANGWTLAYIHGISPASEPILVYPPPDGPKAKTGSAALAIAEAAAFSGSYALPSVKLAKPSGARAIADWRHTVAQLNFLADHSDWFGGKAETTVDVLADSIAPVTEVMNLLVRRNLPFQAVSQSGLPENAPAVLILVGQKPLAGTSRETVAKWKAGGTTVIEKASAPDPSAFAAEVRDALGARRPFRLTNAQQVIATVSTVSDGKRVMHVLNYGIDPIQDVRVLHSRPISRATLFVPGEVGGKMLPLKNGEFSIPEMGAYGAVLLEESAGILPSRAAKADVELTANPETPFWKDAPVTVALNDRWAKELPGYRTEIRSRWTKDNLYFLFVCHYEELFLHPNPSTNAETNKLWEWDVAEVFIGSDFKNIRQYKELQVSPQGEWVDLDIDRDHPKPEASAWNSGYQVKARIDRDRKIWYGEMKIPMSAIDTRPAKAGNELRMNFYRIQGPPKPSGPLNTRTLLSWQPTYFPNNHVPESFGKLRME